MVVVGFKKKQNPNKKTTKSFFKMYGHSFSMNMFIWNYLVSDWTSNDSDYLGVIGFWSCSSELGLMPCQNALHLEKEQEKPELV